MQDHEKCVDAGEVWLEENAPQGYRDRLIEAHKAGEFDLGSVSRCVLAHAFPDDVDGDVIPGHYLTVITEHDDLFGPGLAEAKGFCWDAYADWSELQEAWERRIAAWQEGQVPA